jgi:hypothetical protein
MEAGLITEIHPGMQTVQLYLHEQYVPETAPVKKRRVRDKVSRTPDPLPPAARWEFPEGRLGRRPCARSRAACESHAR